MYRSAYREWEADIQIMSEWVCQRETQEKGRKTQRTLTDKKGTSVLKEF